MRLTAPTSAPQLELPDTQGQTITLGDGGRPTLLCFFRDAACPFCNLRVYELTERQLNLYLSKLDPSGQAAFDYHLVATMPVTAVDGGAQAFLYYQPEKKSTAPAQQLKVTGG